MLISLCENQKTIQWSLFLGHGLMAHIPWPLSQSNPWKHNDPVFKTGEAIFFFHFNLVPRLNVSLLSATDFEKSCDKIAQPDWLTLLAIRSDECRKSRERAHEANAGEFNRRYLTCQISAFLYADRGDTVGRWK